MRVASLSPERRPDTPPSAGYTLKRLLLGKPLINDALTSERLSNPIALGVLSPDAISSTAYGTELILLELLPFAALAAFTLLLPITGAILLILVLVAASYVQVVTSYTRAGGSYVVARENFGPRVAQIAAAALLIDYVVTVAVQAAAGTVAVVSALRWLGPYSLVITVAVVLLMCWVNLRGLREAGRPFAVPTYFFVTMMTAMIVVGVVRELTGDLPRYDPQTLVGAVEVHHADGLVMGATILVLLRAFANGGASLTGVEAISNTVSSLRAPEGANARKVLIVMASILGFLLAGIAWLAFETHATPYVAGYPSVLSEIARAVFGDGLAGHVAYALVQISTAAILFTGANTSFNGFPALANFVAEDRFLPRQLAKRGHRLVFSNGIIVLTVFAVLLLVGTGGSVSALVPFYAIGVFTGFAMAGYGMTKHHLTHREPGWRHKLAVNLSAGVLATVVVGIFAVAKFTEGAWLVVVVFPVLVFVLIRLNREYRTEAAILETIRGDRPDTADHLRHRVVVLVDGVDLAVVEALRYGNGLRADELTAVHFCVDDAHADALRARWEHLRLQTPLRIVECPDRRLTRAAQELVIELRDEAPGTEVTVLLPRRSYAPLLGRLIHDRTADRIARAISRISDAAATIVPYDVQARIRAAYPDLLEERITRYLRNAAARVDGDATAPAPQPAPVIGIDGLITGHRGRVEGRVRQLLDGTREGLPVRVAVVGDDSGELRVVFTPGHGPDVAPGQLLRVTGTAHRSGRLLTMTNPDYLVLEGESP
jgi:amino acid transporter